MPKGFASQICVYCQQAKSTPTGDHAIPRSFFTLEDRDNIPKVPACVSCNNKKSVLEHYLASTLPFGGKHSSAEKYLTEFAPGRLAKNQKLQRDLARDKKHVLLQEPDLILRSQMTLPFEGEKYTDFFGYVAVAMLWHEWRKRVPAGHKVEAICLTPTGEEAWSHLLHMDGQRDVSGSFANGAFQYRLKCSDREPIIVISIFSLYGGIDVASEDRTRHGRSRYVGVLIAPKEQVKKLCMD